MLIRGSLLAPIWFAWVALSAALSECQQQQQHNPPIDLDSSKLVNLNDILVHQQALIEQCRQLESERLAELSRMLKLSRELGGERLQLDSRFALKLPAVCLFLIGPPEFNATSDQLEPAAEDQLPRLDMVNWIYESDQLAAANSSSGGGKTKRQAANYSGEPGGLLNDFWFDLNKLEAAGNELESEPELEKFHAQMGTMLADERFQEAIRLEANKIAPYLSPVVLIPGLAGSRIQARVVAKRRKVNIICSQAADWQDLWLRLRSFLPLAIDCWIDNVRMELDPASGWTRDALGVESRVPDFGSVDSVRHMDLQSPKLTAYFDALIQHYQRLGYQPDRNLFGAPYDFRLAPQQIERSFFEPLKRLIEFANSNGGQTALAAAGASAGRLEASQTGAAVQKVTLVCHSMGCLHALIFLRRQSGAWRQARVRKLIAISSPWGGTVKALKALLVGEQFGLPLVSELKMRKLARTFPGVAYMLPQAEVFERPNKDQVEPGGRALVETPRGQFRVGQLRELMEAAGLEQQWRWFERSAPLIEPLRPLPDLQLDCLHSLNIPTPETIIFRNATGCTHCDYELVQGDGDGTVNHQSLLVCGLWASQLPHRVRHKIVMNTNHVGILSHKSLLEHISDDVLTSAGPHH